MAFQEVSSFGALLQFYPANDAYSYLFPNHTHPGPFSLYVCALF
jgi:hypothetical protein